MAWVRRVYVLLLRPRELRRHSGKANLTSSRGEVSLREDYAISGLFTTRKDPCNRVCSLQDTHELGVLKRNYVTLVDESPSTFQRVSSVTPFDFAHDVYVTLSKTFHEGKPALAILTQVFGCVSDGSATKVLGETE